MKLKQHPHHFVLLALMCVPVASCVDNSQSLFIQGVLPRMAPACTVTYSPSTLTRGRGVLDVALSTDYRATLLAANQLIPRGDGAAIKTEPNRIVLHGAEVELTDSEGAVPDGTFSVFAAGFVEVGSGETPGYGGLTATLIPHAVGIAYSEELQNEGLGASREVVARVRVYGETLGGITIDSAEYLFPIEICYGCLIDYPMEALEFSPSGDASCTANPDMASNVGCYPGQDETVDCRACATKVSLCLYPPI